MKIIQKLTAYAVLLSALLLQYVKAGCPPGMFGELGHCNVCPEEYYCPGDTLEPFQCPPGYSSISGESDCHKITEEWYAQKLNRNLFSCSSSPGYYCSGGSTFTECSSGYYCPGSSSQSQCPAGYSCMLTNTYSVCSSGYYSLLGDDYCHICPRGSYCSSTSSYSSCSSGQYSYEGATSCTNCPVGYKCPSTSQSPSLCAHGEYQTSGSSTTCSNCPAGSSCTNSGSSTCSSGYYSLSGVSYCSPCPAGYSCSSGVLGSACSSGYYSAEGVDGCSACTAGYYCPNADSQYKCPEGYYSAATSTSCTICPTGYYCTGGYQYTCPHLTYSDDTGLSACKKVPQHYIADSFTGATSVTRCTAFEYTDALQLTCYTCDDAHLCLSDDTVEPCPYGHLKLDSKWYCKPCPNGVECTIDGSGDSVQTDVTDIEGAGSYSSYTLPMFSGLGELHAKICPPNNYCDDYGENYHICPHGTYPDFTGCTDCPSGKICMTSYNRQDTVTSGSVSSLGDSFPRFQPQGYTWDDSTGWTDEKDFVSTRSALGRIGMTSDGQLEFSCPTGYSWTHAIHQRCPSTHMGKLITSEDVGMIAEDQHIQANYDSLTDFTYTKLANSDTDTDVQCLPCNGGYYCRVGSDPVSCSSGTYSPTGEPDCLICPPGHYCTSKSEYPTPCTYNKYRENAGATTSTDCSSCPTGYYAPAGSPQCTTCPAGYECSTGVPILCEIGQYSGEGEISCSACQEGYICDKGSWTPTPPENICPKGSYCMTSGSYTLKYRCDAGKYGIAIGATDSAWCITCPPGYICREGTDDFTKYPWPKGYYCPSGSTIATAWPAGFYNPNRQAMSSDNCLTWPAGFSWAEASHTPTIWPSGSYCPKGTTDSSIILCPMGTYTGTRTGAKMRSECLPCPAGSYCDEGTITPTPAPVGYYIPYMGATGLSAALKCPAGYPCETTGNYRYSGSTCTKGYYCPPGSSSATGNPCPAGTYSDRIDLWDESQCTIWPSGYYCDSASTSAEITICPQGYYCVAGTGSSTQYPCPTGTYGATTGLKAEGECTNCTAGGSCSSGSTSTVTCSQGYYCPAGTTTSTPSDYQAPAGSFINFTGAASEYDNYPCGYGNYCPAGSTGAIACAAGTYSNILRAEEWYTWPAGYYCSGTGVIDPTLCSAGYYSAEGATACTRCPEGYYCHQEGTSETTMLSQPCPAGTICSLDVSGTLYGLDVSPDLVSHACPAGSYCVGGSASTLCPAGTYNSIPGRTSLSDCLTTPAGFYTGEGATEYLSTECQEGYYCLEGSTTATEYSCPAGTFRNIKKGSTPQDCAICWSGYKCPNEATNAPEDCGAGYYCPIGTIIPALCPVGTYSAELNLPDSRSCTKCPTGYYCGSKGMTGVTTDDYCDAGFYCVEGAYRPDPTDGITGYICPAGGYCLAGATSVSPCPTGEYNPEEGAKTSDSCILCMPGKYCSGSSNPEPTGDCNAGFYWPAGSSSPTQNSVSEGYYAPSGSDIEIPCARGTYQPANESESCIDCEAGNYCPDVGMTAPLSCPAGYYCLSNTYFTGSGDYYEAIPCSSGTFNSLESQATSSSCVSCSAGKYCQDDALSAETGTCYAGFYCEFGSVYPNPAFDVDTASGHYGPCPMGSHCAASTSTPTECVAGTYSAMTKLEDNTYCKDCEPGHYCDVAGLDAPTGECDPGYYCDAGSTVSNQNECTAKNYCPQGSANEFRCPIGFYNTATGQGACTDCGSGYVCFDGDRADCS